MRVSRRSDPACRKRCSIESKLVLAARISRTRPSVVNAQSRTLHLHLCASFTADVHPASLYHFAITNSYNIHLVALVAKSQFLSEFIRCQHHVRRHCNKVSGCTTLLVPHACMRSGSGPAIASILPRFWRFMPAPSPYLDWSPCGYTSLSFLTARHGPLFFAFNLARSRWRMRSMRPSRRHTNFLLFLFLGKEPGPCNLLDSSSAPSSFLGITQTSTDHNCARYTFPTISFEVPPQTCGLSACSSCRTTAAYGTLVT